ncbi:MAG: membrane protein insertion efficiency factor YidD [Saprospiraceae bacterium]|nr:membrane protein insertion efficiency factor YidD [Saprospiraceae bacterium]MBP7679635.1 membrane protein insertion efficiency factor YidD [Saprospiraceae bacterium]
MIEFWIRRIVILPIRFYKLIISPLLPPSCRYRPTCSQYMIEAIMEWGIIKGTWLGLKRIGRCHPFSNHDMYDPIPKRKP